MYSTPKSGVKYTYIYAKFPWLHPNQHFIFWPQTNIFNFDINLLKTPSCRHCNIECLHDCHHKAGTCKIADQLYSHFWILTLQTRDVYIQLWVHSLYALKCLCWRIVNWQAGCSRHRTISLSFSEHPSWSRPAHKNVALLSLQLYNKVRHQITTTGGDASVIMHGSDVSIAYIRRLDVVNRGFR